MATETPFDLSLTTSSVLIVVSTVIILTVIKVITRIRSIAERKRSLPFPNIPFTVPNPHWLFGHVHLFANINNGTKKLCIDHASPTGISTFWMFGKPCMCSIKAQHVRLIFQNNTDRDFNRFFRRHANRLLGTNSLVLSTGDAWAHGRNVTMRALTYTRDVLPMMQQVAQRFIRSILSLQPLTMDMIRLQRMVLLDIFGTTCLGYDFECTSDGLRQHEIADSFEFLTAEVTRRAYREKFSLASHLYWIPTPYNRRSTKAMKTIQTFLKRIIQQRRRELRPLLEKQTKRETLKTQDLLGQVLLRSNEALTDDYLLDFLATLLFGGYDTTSIAFSHAFFFLAKNPRAERQCLEEARSVLSRNETIVDPAKSLAYCHAVMLESLRLVPPIPNLPRDIVKPVELKDEGITVEKGTKFIAFVWWVHRHPDNFARGEEFLPERWVKWNPEEKCWVERSPDDEEEQKEMENDDDGGIPAADMNNLFSFSSGPRFCPGRRFSSFQSIIVFAYMVRDLKIDIAEGFEDLEYVLNWPLSAPKDGLKMVIKKREEEN